MNFPPHRKHGKTVRYNSDVDDALGSGDEHPPHRHGRGDHQDKSETDDGKSKDSHGHGHAHGHKHGQKTVDDHVADRHHEENVLGQTNPASVRPGH